jgi:glycosyltransferase involved in cell wall biosynthesis
MAGAWSRAGYEVVIAVPRLRAPGAAPWGQAVDADVITLEPPARRGPRRLDELRQHQHARALLDACPKQVDRVWARHAALTDAPTQWARQHGLRCDLEVNAPAALERDLDGDPIRWRRWADHLERRALTGASRVWAVSQWLADWATSRGAHRVHHLPNGTDARAGPFDRDAIRRSLGLSGLVLGFVGSHKPWHRLDRLNTLLDWLPDAHALVVGEGPSPPAEHPRIRTVADPDPSPWIAAMDVGLVLGGRPWVNPLKILDYRALGVPVVSVPVGDSAALIGDGGEVGPFGPDWTARVRRQAARRLAPSLRRWDDVVLDVLRRD